MVRQSFSTGHRAMHNVTFDPRALASVPGWFGCGWRAAPCTTLPLLQAPVSPQCTGGSGGGRRRVMSTAGQGAGGGGWRRAEALSQRRYFPHSHHGSRRLALAHTARCLIVTCVTSMCTKQWSGLSSHSVNRGQAGGRNRGWKECKTTTSLTLHMRYTQSLHVALTNTTC